MGYDNKDNQDIRDDEITDIKDNLVNVFYSALKSHGISLSLKQEDQIGDWVCEELDKRGPING